MRLIVSDAGPLIALSRIERLPLLGGLFETVLIPGVVLGELRLEEHRPGVGPLREAVEQGKWIRSAVAEDERPIPGLDDGEACAIGLAAELNCPLLIDERRGRTAAKHHGVVVFGTGRVLLYAKAEGLIESVRVVLDELRTAGYRLSDDICQRLLQLASE